MTKETKIGLLVGLAFIILFAIILSEKGTPQRSAALPTFTVADGSKSTTPPLTGSDQPLSGAGRLPITSQLPPIIQPKPQNVAPPSPVIMTEEPVAQAAPKQEETISSLPESVVGFLNSMPIKGEPITSTEQPKTERVATSNPPAITIPPMVASSAKPESTKSKPANKIASPTATNEISSTLTASREPAKPAEKPLVIKTVHTVQPGESLGKIAAKYYGRSTPARVEALYKANQDRLKDTHQVKVQQKLDIPDLGEANSAFQPVTALTLRDAGAIHVAPKTSDAIRIPIPVRERTTPAEPSLQKLSPPDAKQPTIQMVSAPISSKKTKTSEASYQWYEVRPKDSLSKIARQQLGSEKHLNELCQLNKDRLGKKNILKPGMRLRIPLKSAASIEPQTAVSSNGFGNEN